MIPTIIPTAYKAKTTASRGCVSSQATSSARLRPTGQLRIVDRTLDLRLRTDGSRGADDLIRYSDRTTCDARGTWRDVLRESARRTSSKRARPRAAEPQRTRGLHEH